MTLSDREEQKVHDYALLERARISQLDEQGESTERLFRDCLDVPFEDVRAAAAHELADALRARNRVAEADRVIQDQINRSPIDAYVIREGLQTAGDIERAIDAYRVGAAPFGKPALRLAGVLEQRGDVDGAQEALELALTSRDMLIATEAKTRLARLTGRVW